MSLFDRQPSTSEPHKQPRIPETERASFTTPNFTGAPMEEKPKAGQLDIIVHALLFLSVGCVLGWGMYELLLPLHKGHVKTLSPIFSYVAAFYKIVGFWPAVLIAPALGAFSAFCYFCKLLSTRYS
ncbi:MAG: hypothetical protein ACAI35_13690 [Candidatus Methylacidiphilales bacterium]|nr:hypothetical protein [Candidatus Methylacidiphilales bacterium]